ATIQSNSKITNQTLVVGVPEHLNQINELVVEHENINDKLEELKRNQIINTNIGVVSSTLFALKHKNVKLITVGLGNLKTTDYSGFLKVFGNLFQHLKKERVTQASLLFESRSEEHTSELQSRFDIVCRLLLEKKKYFRKIDNDIMRINKINFKNSIEEPSV